MEPPKCDDCKLPYEHHGLDITFPHDQWALISPDNGLLCGTCIARRASQLPGSIAIRASIHFAL